MADQQRGELGEPVGSVIGAGGAAPDRGRSWDRRQTAGVALVGAVLTAVLAFTALANAVVPPPEAGASGYTRPYSPPHSPFEVILIRGDGQAYAVLAADPTMADPSGFIEGSTQAAYFAQRPVLVYGVWLVAAGDPGRFVVGFVVMTLLGSVALVAGASALVQRARPGRDHRLAVLLLCLPGSVMSIQWLAHEVLAVGLGVAGLAAWVVPRRRGWAALLFTGAVLTRESMALAVVVLAVAGVVGWMRGDRSDPARRTDLGRDLVSLAAPGLVLVGWFTVIRLRYGSAGKHAAHNFALPFAGIAERVPGWGAADVAIALLGLVLVGLALWWAPREPATWIALAYALLGLVLSKAVWLRMEDFSRVLLPAYVFAALGFALRPRSGRSGLRLRESGR